MLEFMRDTDNPPGFRGEMAKAAAPYVLFSSSRSPWKGPSRDELMMLRSA
jgi:hypothetical protein